MLRQTTRLRFAAALSALAWSACTFPAVEQTAVRTYLLTAEGSPARLPEGTERPSEKRGILLVSVPQASPGYDTARMIYQKRPQEVNYYAASQWADTPGRMLHPLLVRALASTETFDAVVQTPSVARGDYRLDSDDLILEQQFFERPTRVYLSIRLQLIDLKDLNVIGTRTFQAMEASPSEDAYGGVVAANRAVSRLLGEIEEWLATRMAEIRRGGG